MSYLEDDGAYTLYPDVRPRRELISMEEAEEQDAAGLFFGVCSGCKEKGHRFARCPNRAAVVAAIRAKYPGTFAGEP
jgi:hypothetical protein